MEHIETKETEKANIILTRSAEFAVEVIQLCYLLKQEREYVLSNQLMRSGTSIGANVEEAIAGCSKRDFIYKMRTALKEARETIIG